MHDRSKIWKGYAMTKIDNKIMLITYPDSMGGDLLGLQRILEKYFRGAVGGIHILPFFPSSGDRGFSPVTYDLVDPAFGDWENIESLSQQYYLMCDVMANHISRQSAEFRDYVQKGATSRYADMFISFDDFWGGEPSKDEVEQLYRRKEGLPFTDVRLDNGEVKRLWCSFSNEQIDLNTNHPVAREYIMDTLRKLGEHGISLVRLDAYGYITKVRGTDCFFVEPQIWDLIEECERLLEKQEMALLPEVHATYDIALKISRRGYWTYDFVLPLLVLHTLYSGSAKELVRWLAICPRKQFTVLDTHDGVGVYDAAGIVSDEQVKTVTQQMENQLSYSYKPLDAAKKRFYRSYQLYGTFYSMLQENDDAYLLARAIQFFAPGIPQVYYVGMLADINDLNFPEQDHRFINRQNYTEADVKRLSQRRVVQNLTALMKVRNEHPAFHGDLVANESKDGQLTIERRTEAASIKLVADLKTRHFSILDGDLKILYQQ